jgi:hypothetical protein
MKCNSCDNTKEFISYNIDKTLHIYDPNGDEVDAFSIGYDRLPNSDMVCNSCGSDDTKETK